MATKKELLAFQVKPEKTYLNFYAYHDTIFKLNKNIVLEKKVLSIN